MAVKIIKPSLFRYITAPIRVNPDFLIIGAQKSGTTKLYANLIKHPDIIPALRKEVHFFDKDKAYKKSGLYYKTFFPTFIAKKFNKGSLTGEATPDYLYKSEAPERIKKTLGAKKFIVLLRNPIDMAYSLYNMLKREGIEDIQEFDEAIEKRDFYLERASYVQQLENWFKYFQKENFLILKSEDLFGNYHEGFNQVLEFLGLEKVNESVEFEKPPKPRNYESMSQKTRDRLNEYFKNPNQKLYDLIGEDFGW